MNAANPQRRRALIFALAFWAALAGFIALDWTRSAPHNRFDEPPPWAMGQEPGEGGGHCAAPLK
jgi:hypothetical protein